MPEEELPRIPRELERYVDKPYGGLFGNSVHARVLKEIVANPYSDYRPRDLERLLEVSANSIRNALRNLTALRLLEKDTSDVQHPIYHVNLESKKLIALTFLAYATMDDRQGSNLMNTAILDYYLGAIKPEMDVLAAGNFHKIQYGGMTFWEATMVTPSYTTTEA